MILGLLIRIAIPGALILHLCLSSTLLCLCQNRYGLYTLLYLKAINNTFLKSATPLGFVTNIYNIHLILQNIDFLTLLKGICKRQKIRFYGTSGRGITLEQSCLPISKWFSNNGQQLSQKQYGFTFTWKHQFNGEIVVYSIFHVISSRYSGGNLDTNIFLKTCLQIC